MPDPIASRLDQLHDQWVSFADDAHARMLVWRAEPDERSFVDAFLTRESDAERAETPDLFLRLEAPYQDESTHDAALAAELLALARESDVELGAHSSLLGALHAFHARFRPQALVVVWLDPSAVAADTYKLWLQRLVYATPDWMRVLAIAGTELDALAAVSSRVRTIDCELDVVDAMDALTDRPGARGPDDLLRRLLVRMQREPEHAHAIVREGITLAGTQGWSEVVGALQLALASTLAARGELVPALGAYDAAAEVASLRAIARLGQGALWLNASEYARARDVYLGMTEHEDLTHQLDSYRLASFCCMQLGDRERAWQLGLRGLEVATRMDDTQRERSTLPYLADQLTRVRGSSVVEAKLRELLGTRWRAQLATVA
ncbi:MAG: hypothetical protein ABW352_16570 [Polyangiales bacterium]